MAVAVAGEGGGASYLRTVENGHRVVWRQRRRFDIPISALRFFLVAFVFLLLWASGSKSWSYILVSCVFFLFLVRDTSGCLSTLQLRNNTSKSLPGRVYSTTIEP